MKSLLTIYCFILLMADCKYDNTVAARSIQVPDYTETGANTFGAMINDRVWLNFGKYRQGTELGVQYRDNVLQKSIGYNYPPPITDTLFTLSGQLSILEKGNTVREEQLYITLKKNRGAASFVGQYLLGGTLQYSTNQPVISAISYSDHITWVDHKSLDKDPVTVIVKKDVIQDGKHIISGIFQGSVYNSQTGTDPIKIVGGVFDTDLFH